MIFGRKIEDLLVIQLEKKKPFEITSCPCLYIVTKMQSSRLLFLLLQFCLGATSALKERESVILYN